MIKYKNIDEALGSSEKRYFGQGYKKVKYRRKDSILLNNSVMTTYSISYPHDWSLKKSQKQLNPHLSTLDVLVISIETIELFLIEKLGFSNLDLKKMSVSDISIKAGNRLLEDIDQVKSRFEFLYKENLSFEGKVENFSVMINISNEKLKTTKGEECRNKSLVLKDITIDDSSSLIKALSIFINKHKFEGINSIIISNQQTAFLISHIIVAAQLTEALLAHMDNIKRDNSNTLIMRKINIKRLESALNLDKKVILIQLNKSKVLTIRDQRIRVSEMTSSIDDSCIVCSVAQNISKSEEIK